MNRREQGEFWTLPDVTRIADSQPSAVQAPAKVLPNNPRETFEARPDFEAPRTAKRQAQSWTQCRCCSCWYAAPNKKLNQGKSMYCTIRCAADHATATGKFKGANNPRWLGGVSNDNMRYRRRQKERDPIEEAARAMVYNAVKRGDLVRAPCETCGATKVEGHHDDYSNPLSVRWLCRAHHTEHHVNLRKAA